MYIPDHFNEADTSKTLNLIRDHSFGTLITIRDTIPFASHIPFIVEGDQNITLIGHLAKSNEQWKHFESDQQVLVIFQGPHAYVSPSWYESPGVPTWNYTAVHLYGIPKLITEGAKLIDAIEKLTHIHETKNKTSWKLEYPSNMLKTIVGFEIHVQKVESKFKLSQNRPKADRDNVTYELLRSEIDRDKDLGKLMMKNQS